MIDLLRYEPGDSVEIHDVDGKVFCGEVVEIIWPQEKSDLEEKEYSIVIQFGECEIEFLQSEIEKIVRG